MSRLFSCDQMASGRTVLVRAIRTVGSRRPLALRSSRWNFFQEIRERREPLGKLPRLSGYNRPGFAQTAKPKTTTRASCNLAEMVIKSLVAGRKKTEARVRFVFPTVFPNLTLTRSTTVYRRARTLRLLSGWSSFPRATTQNVRWRALRWLSRP